MNKQLNGEFGKMNEKINSIIIIMSIGFLLIGGMLIVFGSQFKKQQSLNDFTIKSFNITNQILNYHTSSLEIIFEYVNTQKELDSLVYWGDNENGKCK